MTDTCCPPSMPGPAGHGWSRVVLVGNPNVGKSTLFNRLTGARQRVANVPRTTVEVATGTWQHPAFTAGAVAVTDLPGTYDTSAGSPDEQVAVEALTGTAAVPRPDLAVVLLDATALGRSLYLLAQVGRLEVPVVVAVTMADVAAARGIAVSPADLAVMLGVPVVILDPRTGSGRDALGRAVAGALASPILLRTGADSDGACLDWADATQRRLHGPSGLPAPVRTWSDKVDRVLLTPWLGIPAFLAVLWGMLQLVTVAAAPLMAAIDGVWNGPVLDGARRLIPGDGWWQDAAVDGVLAGVGVVLSFAPLMALTFIALAILEDSGYMARAAVVADRGMRAIGLNGQATLPLIIGFGCNLPALAALKTLPNARQRLAVGLLVPFTSCTARLPVYLLMASAFFPGRAGTVVFLMYLASAAVVISGGLIMKGTLLRGDAAGATIMVLPAYQRPRLLSLLASAWARTRAFVTRAGKVITVALAALWLLAATPTVAGVGFGEAPIQDTAYGAVADAVAPVFSLAGFGDWRASSALVSGFVAKEIVVGVFAQSFALEDPADPGDAPTLDAQLRATFNDASGGHPQAAAAAFLLFVLLYTPCVATLGEMRRQLGWRWTGAAVAVGLCTAYAAAVVAFQVGRLL